MKRLHRHNNKQLTTVLLLATFFMVVLIATPALINSTPLEGTHTQRALPTLAELPAAQAIAEAQTDSDTEQAAEATSDITTSVTADDTQQATQPELMATETETTPEQAITAQSTADDLASDSDPLGPVPTVTETEPDTARAARATSSIQSATSQPLVPVNVLSTSLVLPDAPDEPTSRFIRDGDGNALQVAVRPEAGQPEGSPGNPVQAMNRASLDPLPVPTDTNDLPRGARGRTALMQRAQTDGSVRVIMQLATSGPLDAASIVTDAAAQAQIDSVQQDTLNALAGLDVQVNARFDYIPALGLTVDAEALDALYDLPGVVSIEPDALVRPTLFDAASITKANVSRELLNYTGAGAAIAIIDSGIDLTHSFFEDENGQSRIVAEACYNSTVPANGATTRCPNGLSEDVSPGSGQDCPAAEFDANGNYLGGILECSHGTHVAGIAAGRNDNAVEPGGSQTGLYGIAPDAKLIAINTFSEFQNAALCGSGIPCILAYRTDIQKGMERVLTLNTQFENENRDYQIAAVNMSLGEESNLFEFGCDFGYTSLVDQLHAQGIAVVIAAGNGSDTSRVSVPGCVANAITVSAVTNRLTDTDTDPNDGGADIASFSNMSNLVDLLAPGVSIASSYLFFTDGPSVDSYAFLGGTSMAAPMVAGAVAVMRGAMEDAGTTPADETQIVPDMLNALQTTGVPVTDQRPGGTISKRSIRLDAALGDLGVVSCPTYSFPVTVPAGNTAALIEAINNARNDACFPGPDVINLTNSTYSITQPYESNLIWGLPVIDSPITINGNGATISVDAAVNVSNATVEGFRHLLVKNDFVLNDVTLEGGFLDIVDGEGNRGGAMFVQLGETTTNNVRFINNRSLFYGGAVFVDDSASYSSNNDFYQTNTAQFGGALNNEGTVRLSQVVMDSNRATDDDGLQAGGAGGGAIYNGGRNAVVDAFYSAFTNNEAQAGGSSGGGIENRGLMTLIGAQISGNDAIFGAGLINQEYYSDLTVINSSIFGNSVDSSGTFVGGAAFNQYYQSKPADDPTEPLANFYNSTIVDNSTQSPNGAMFIERGSANVRNSIVAGNPGPLSVQPECTVTGNATLNTDGANIFGINNNAGGCPLGSSDQLHGGPLTTLVDSTATDNGGLRLTLALPDNSSAINAGDASLLPDDLYDLDNDSNVSEPLPFDQRGPGFERVSQGGLDVGALETGCGVLADSVDIADGDVQALIAAIERANDEDCNPGQDVLNLAADGTYTLTSTYDGLDGPNGLPSVASDIVINGNNATIERSTDEATPNFRVLRVAKTGTLTLSAVTLQNGDANTPDNNNGGGLRNSGIATLNNVTVQNNTDSGIRNEGTLTITNSLIKDNTGDFGGGINNFADSLDADAAAAQGLDIPLSAYEGQQQRYPRTQDQDQTQTQTQTPIEGSASLDDAPDLGTDAPAVTGIPHTLTLVNVRVEGNSAALARGGGLNNEGEAQIIRSTFISNSNSNDSGQIVEGGGAIWNNAPLLLLDTTLTDNTSATWGGGFVNIDGSVSMVNSTLSGNASTGAVFTHGGGAINQFGNGTINSINSTITGNTAVQAGRAGIMIESSTFTARNSIIAGNGTQADCDIFAPATFTADGNNLFGTQGDDGGCTAGASDIVPDSPLDAIIGPLTEVNGIQVHPLADASPAIDAGNNTHLPADETDQNDNGNTSETLPLDQANNARRADDSFVTDTGIAGPGGTPLVDIGAVERQDASCQASDLYTIADGDVAGLITALKCANAQSPFADDITLATDGSYTLTEDYTGGYGLPVVQVDATVIGNGATIERSAANDTPDFGLLHVGTNGSLELQNLTLRNGVGGTVNNQQAGGAVLNQGALTLTGVTLTGNTGSALRNLGTLTVSDSTFSDNSGALGAAINTYQPGGNDPETRVENSTFNGNTAQVGGAVYNDALAFITNSTLAANSADTNGGGIYNAGNGSTIITNVTLANNDASNGANVYSVAGGVRFRNTLLAAPQGGANCAFTTGDTSNFADDGGNLEEAATGSCGFAAAAVVSDAGLVEDQNNVPSLADNGGPTQTIALAAGSPAENNVPANNCYADLNRNGVQDSGETLTQDQRGITRPQGDACDTGAYEQDQTTCPVDSFTLTSNAISDLIFAFECAQSHSGAQPYAVSLLSDATYTLTGANNTLDGPNGLPVIQNAVSVQGNNAVIERSDANGTPEFRFFMVNETGDLRLSDLTLRNGEALVQSRGGAIRNSGLLDVQRVSFEGSVGAAITNENQLTVNESVFRDGSATFGAAINAFDDGVASTTASTTDSIDQLAFGYDPGDLDTTSESVQPFTDVRNSSFLDNNASNAGAAIYATGRALLTNSTFVGNSGIAGTVFNGIGSETLLTNSTFAANSTNHVYTSGATTLRNTILADARGTDACQLQSGGSIIDAGGNIEEAEAGETSTCNLPAAALVTAAGLIYADGDPALNTATNGVLYVPLEIGSPAINNVPEGNCFVDVDLNGTADSGEALDRDAAGDPRPFGDFCDSGADETEASAVVTVELQLVDLDSTPGIGVNEQFRVDVLAYDTVSMQAVFSAYMDVLFDQSTLRVDAIEYTAGYPISQVGSIDNTNGIVDEVGATASLSQPQDPTVFSLLVTGTQQGESSITTEAAEGVARKILLSEEGAQDYRDQTDFGSLTVNIEGGDPDLLISSFDATPDHMQNGDTTINYVLENRGGRSAGAFDVGLYLSADATCAAADDTLLTSVGYVSLMADSERNESIQVNISKAALYTDSKNADPANLGDGHQSTALQYVCAVVDVNDDVDEGNEANNSSQGLGIDLDDITYFPWDTDSNGFITPLDALNTILALNSSSKPQYDFDGNGVVTPTEALDALLRLGYVRNNDVIESPDSSSKLPSLPVGPRSDGVTTAVQLEIVELDRTAGIVAGEAFNVNVYMTDTETARAVFSGFVDLQYDPALLRVDGVRYGEGFSLLQSASIDNTAGVVDDLGATLGRLQPSDNTLVAIVRMQATAAGISDITTSGADGVLAQTTSFSNPSDQRNTMHHASLTLTVNPTLMPTATLPALPVAPPRSNRDNANSAPMQPVAPQASPTPLPVLPVGGR